MKDKNLVYTHNSSSLPSQDLPFVVGVDLGGTQIRTAVLQGARRLSRVGLLTGENPTPDRLIPRICQAIRQAIAESGVPLHLISGIGVGAPGPLNSHTGVVFSPPNLPGWENIPLRAILHAEFHLPVILENDANAAALGEQMFGAGRNSREMVYLTISTGIGGGIISNGRILQGIAGTAAEIGHMSVDWRGPRCNCGNIGCLESFTSGTAIARRANELIALGKADDLLTFTLSQITDATSDTPEDRVKSASTPIHVNAKMVSLAAEAGVVTACDIIKVAAEALGVGLINIIHLFNPELIILGGGVAQIGAPLLEPAKRLMQERAMRVPFQSATIVMAELGSDVGLVGAGALIYYHQ